MIVYAVASAALVAAGVAIARGGRARTLALAAIAVAVVGFLAVLAAKPETVRFYLQYGYNWIPAGAWLAAADLVWRGREPQARDLQWRTGLLVALTLGAATANTYASFNPFPNALFPEATPYVLPLAAVFFAWLHVYAFGRGRPARGRRRHAVHRRAGARQRRPRDQGRARRDGDRAAARTAASPRAPPRRPRSSRRSTPSTA